VIGREDKRPTFVPGRLLVSVPSLSLRHVHGGVRAATLTLAVSLPLGLLALPIAFAEVGIIRGLGLLVLLGAINTVTTAWTAQAVATFFVQHGVVPSLPQLARERLGPWGELLTRTGGAALFSLALVASMVGLARNLADLSGLPASLWGGCCALAILIFVLWQSTISTRLLIGLGILNISLTVIVCLGLFPHAQVMRMATEGSGSAVAIAGVSQMLFFAPMLLGAVARYSFDHGHHARTLVAGSAAGVAAGTILFGLWAVAVCSVVGNAELATAGGTPIPALLGALPTARLPILVLGLSLLGMTALRCAAVLSSIAEELLPQVLEGPRRRLAVQLPVGLCLTISLALLLHGTTSFTDVITVAGVAAASIISLVVPAMLARCGSTNDRTSAASDRSDRTSTLCNQK
jgi:amino acid permease